MAKSAGKAGEQVAISFGFICDWLRKRSFSQSRSLLLQTKVITLVSRNAHGIQVNQSESEANPRSRHKAREIAREHVVVCFGFTSDWCRKWRFRQS